MCPYIYIYIYIWMSIFIYGLWHKYNMLTYIHMKTNKHNSQKPLHPHKQVYYSDIIMGVMASQITSLTIVYWTVYSGADQRKHQSSVSLAFVQGIHRWPVNSLHKWPVTLKMFPFDYVNVILEKICVVLTNYCIHQHPLPTISISWF